MSTPCLIGFRDPNSMQIKYIYSHDDGHPRSAGVKLRDNIKTAEHALKLVEMGDISGLANKEDMQILKRNRFVPITNTLSIYYTEGAKDFDKTFETEDLVEDFRKTNIPYMYLLEIGDNGLIEISVYGTDQDMMNGADINFGALHDDIGGNGYFIFNSLGEAIDFSENYDQRIRRD